MIFHLKRKECLVYQQPYQSVFDASSVWYASIFKRKKGTIILEAATGSVLLKKVVLKISQVSQENTSVGVSFK